MIDRKVVGERQAIIDCINAFALQLYGIALYWEGTVLESQILDTVRMDIRFTARLDAVEEKLGEEGEIIVPARPEIPPGAHIRVVLNGIPREGNHLNIISEALPPEGTEFGGILWDSNATLSGMLA